MSGLIGGMNTEPESQNDAVPQHQEKKSRNASVLFWNVVEPLIYSEPGKVPPGNDATSLCDVFGDCSVLSARPREDQGGLMPGLAVVARARGAPLRQRSSAMPGHLFDPEG
jgi:hypothetical protein